MTAATLRQTAAAVAKVKSAIHIVGLPRAFAKRACVWAAATTRQQSTGYDAYSAKFQKLMNGIELLSHDRDRRS